MESSDRALRGTAATPELWTAVYLMLVFDLCFRALRAWTQLDGKPIGWQEAVHIGVDLLVCPAPLLMAISFRKLLREEMSRNQLSSRSFTICNFWIAQLLVLVYVALAL
ncbi:MAG: hypothetical protein P4L26_13360 [Terracidiphilus sp.]|nr:hypothetical protein [Terracidiphilus sp.]